MKLPISTKANWCFLFGWHRFVAVLRQEQRGLAGSGSRPWADYETSSSSFNVVGIIAFFRQFLWFLKFTRADIVLPFFLYFLEQSKAGIPLVKSLLPTYYELHFPGELLRSFGEMDVFRGAPLLTFSNFHTHVEKYSVFSLCLERCQDQNLPVVLDPSPPGGSSPPEEAPSTCTRNDWDCRGHSTRTPV